MIDVTRRLTFLPGVSGVQAFKRVLLVSYSWNLPRVSCVYGYISVATVSVSRMTLNSLCCYYCINLSVRHWSRLQRLGVQYAT